MNHLEEFHEEMPEEVLKVLYARRETSELKNILKNSESANQRMTT